MAVTIWRGGDWPQAVFNPFHPDLGVPPKAGDLIVMALPDSEPVPPGWTETSGQSGRVCWRIATGTETTFPFLSAWFYGVEPPTDEGTAAP